MGNMIKPGQELLEYNQSSLDEPQMESFMTFASKKLSSADKKLNGATLKKVAEQIEDDRELTPEFFEIMSQSMIHMLAQRHVGHEETIRGPIFTTGVGCVAALMLLPRAQGEWNNIVASGVSTSVEASDVIAGTPVIAVLRNEKAAKALTDSKSHSERIKIWDEALAEKGQNIIAGKELGAYRAGGWGHQPAAFLRGAELVLHAKRRGNHDYGEKPYGVVWLTGLFGAMNSMNYLLMDESRNELRAKLRLGHFANQIEQSMDQISQLYEPGITDPERKAKYFHNISLHSMSAYLALAVSRLGTGLKIIDAFKKIKGNTINADKPLMVGAKFLVKNMPNWMKEIVRSKSYRSHYPPHVQLQRGPLGGVVRIGVSEIWNRLGLDDLRTKLLNRGLVPGVARLFTHFLNPDNLFDGPNVYSAHNESYARYRLFHRLCVQLLDGADPIVGSNTLIDMKRAGSHLDKLPWLKILFGDSDNVLSHGIGEELALQLEMSRYRIKSDKDARHHPNYDEIAWMYDLSGLI